MLLPTSRAKDVLDMYKTNESGPSDPRHGDVWRSERAADNGRKFSVMTVCGHHDPPHVTGYWYGADDYPDSCQHDAIPLPRFLRTFSLVEHYEEATPWD